MPRRKAPENDPATEAPVAGDVAPAVQGVGVGAEARAVQPQISPKEELQKLVRIAYNVHDTLWRAANVANGYVRFIEGVRNLLDNSTLTEEDTKYLKSKFISMLNTILETLEMIKKIKEEVGT